MSPPAVKMVIVVLQLVNGSMKDGRCVGSRRLLMVSALAVAYSELKEWLSCETCQSRDRYVSWNVL